MTIDNNNHVDNERIEKSDEKWEKITEQRDELEAQVVKNLRLPLFAFLSTRDFSTTAVMVVQSLSLYLRQFPLSSLYLTRTFNSFNFLRTNLLSD